MFDQCPVAVSKAKSAMGKHGALGYLTTATMQSFKWAYSYSAIFMVWCAGYLGRSELVTFLKKAKARLICDPGRVSRNRVPESYIFLLDNVHNDGEEADIVKDQWVRNERQLEGIFYEAGLIVHAWTERETIPAGYREVVVWALF